MLIELVDEPMGECAVVEAVALLAMPMAVQRVLRNEDLAACVLVEVRQDLEVALKRVSGLLLIRGPIFRILIQMRREDDAAVLCIGKSVVLPVGLDPCGPIVDYERHIFVEVSPCSLYCASVEAPEGFTWEGMFIVWAIGLVQQLNSPTSRSFLCTDGSHALYGQLTQLAVPISNKVEVTVLTKVTARVLVATLPTWGCMQIHHHLDASRLRVLEYQVDPLPV